jgi:hypothetical protein
MTKAASLAQFAAFAISVFYSCSACLAENYLGEPLKYAAGFRVI